MLLYGSFVPRSSGLEFLTANAIIDRTHRDSLVWYVLLCSAAAIKLKHAGPTYLRSNIVLRPKCHSAHPVPTVCVAGSGRDDVRALGQPGPAPVPTPFSNDVCASLCLTFFEQGLRTWTYRGRYAGEPPTVPSFVPVCNNSKCLRSTQGPSVSSDTEARAPTGASLMTIIVRSA